MSGLAALRAGAGLVSVACADASKLVPELMTESLEHFSLEKKTVVAVGPGLGPDRGAGEESDERSEGTDGDRRGRVEFHPGTDFRGRGVQTILTPHPARWLGWRAGNIDGSSGDGPEVCAGAECVSRVERPRDADRAAGWAGLGESYGLAFDGQGRRRATFSPA